ncbi:MAG: adenine phosphoribosyltransferase [Bdellovibrionaceae bacterium]|nr:adenine phosphoribosyltransferase [Pseudobdellovibrionaceae bacterium]
MDLNQFIRTVPDFPTRGVYFKDISPLLANGLALQQTIDGMLEKIDLLEVDAFVGLESRGFIFASMMAAKTNKGFIPFRKQGKLPPPIVSESYQLEYGSATLEAQSGKGRVVIVDDVLATGGTLQAGMALAEKAGYFVADIIVLIDLTFLNQFKFKDQKVKSLITY